MGVYLGRKAVEVYGGGVKVKPEEEKTVTASTSVIDVIPTEGMAMSKVTVNPTPSEEKTVTAGTSALEVTPTSGKHLSKVTVNPTPSEAKTVTPSASQQIVSPSTGKLLSQVTVDGDADLIPTNIKQGVNIFGVDGELLEEQVTIDGVKVAEKLDLVKRNASLMFDLLPYQCMYSRAVTYNDEIHLFGGNNYDSSDSNRHLVWDGKSWAESTPIPFSTCKNAVTVYRGGIHLLTGYYSTQHYRWDGTSWTSLKQLPWEGNYGTALVYNNELYLFTTNASNSDYRYYK